MESTSRDFTMDLRKLRVLQAVDQAGTLSAAAVRLHLTPSAVSQQIAGLSRELGVPLLERRGRGVVLTGPARVVLRHAAALEE
jgi:DNA-binding transcriptional LysR family regulator